MQSCNKVYLKLIFDKDIKRVWAKFHVRSSEKSRVVKKRTSKIE